MTWYLHSCRALQSNPFVMWFTTSVLVSLVIWLAHYLSAFLTVGSIVMTDLRILGLAAKNQTITQVVDFYSPWMWTGLWVLLFTGLLMLAGDAVLFCTNGAFAINLLVTALAAISGGVIYKNARSWDQAPGPPATAKILACISIILWVGAILSAVEVPQNSLVP